MAKRRRAGRPAHRALSLGGSHWRSDGGPKASYASQAEAQRAANFRWDEDRVELNVYACGFCDSWHMGRSSD